MHYYNENDPKAAAWLRQLIKAEIIPSGAVDERSILDVQPADLAGFVSCHFFAGIGGWAYGLRLAGWPDERPIWTGSCPCQPFSVAGKGLGEKDERHLWPVFRKLIADYRRQIGPIPIVTGEQVASADGRNWLSGVRVDLEALGYDFGAADLCAACAGENGEGWIVLRDKAEWQRIVLSAPNIRQRLFWMGYSSGDYEQWNSLSTKHGERITAGGSSSISGMADAHGRGCGQGGRRESQATEQEGGDGIIEQRSRPGGLANSSGRNSSPEELQRGGEYGQQPKDGGACRLEHAEQQGLERHAGDVDDGNQSRRIATEACRSAAMAGRLGFWADSELLPCTDGKARRIEPGSFPLAHGISGRVGLLRGYGNAINPVLASEFIQAACEALNLK